MDTDILRLHTASDPDPATPSDNESPHATGSPTVAGEHVGHRFANGPWLFRDLDFTLTTGEAHGMPRRTAIDHVVQPLLGQGIDRTQAEDEAIAIMSTFHLTKVAAREFRELSGGEAQRLMLARAIASKPDLLLVDEPTAQLDQRTANDIDNTLTGLAQGNAIVVIATHDPNTRAACTRVIDLAWHNPTNPDNDTKDDT